MSELGIMIQVKDDLLLVNGNEYGSDDGHTFEVLADDISSAKLSELPMDLSIALCNRVIGSRDLFLRQPFCSFENRGHGVFVAHCEVAFIPEIENLEEEAKTNFFRESLRDARLALEPLANTGTLLDLDESTYEDIAYLSFSIRIEDQKITEAEAYVESVESRLCFREEKPMLFICHASEDKTFVERLVRELDRRAFYAWFDKREILVGDSIVDKVNQALSGSKIIIAILSSKSVRKPWVVKELCSSLMRQLDGSKVSILPVLAESCEIPPLLADVKYADFRDSFSKGLDELLAPIKMACGRA
jgi:hypothetical protein